MKHGWVRTGSVGADNRPPYIHAQNVADAHKTLLWMIETGQIIDSVEIEINDPEIYRELNGDEIDRFRKNPNFLLK